MATNWKELDNTAPVYEWSGGAQPTFKDDRTETERETHTVLIGGKDKFMSTFGPCDPKNGNWRNPAPDSYAFWACTPEMAERVYMHVSDRSEIITGKLTKGFPQHFLNRIKRKEALVHIYVVTEDHRYTDEFIPEV